MPRPQRPLRMLGTAVRPDAGAELARLRRVDSALAARDPHPLVVGVAAVGDSAGASTIAALLSQRLETIAPGWVGVLDGDTLAAPQRLLLGAGGDAGSGAAGGGAAAGDGVAGLRQLLADPAAHRARRRIDAYVTAGAVPLLAVAEHGDPLSVTELDLATRVLAHRFPIVVLDLPHGCGGAQLDWVATRADHLIAVAPAATMAARQARDWLGARVLGSSEHGGNEHGANEHGADEHGGNEHGGNEHGGSKHGARRRGGNGVDRGEPPSATIVASLVDRSAALVSRAVGTGAADGAGTQLRWPDESALRPLARTGLADVSARARAVIDALAVRATAGWPSREQPGR